MNGAAQQESSMVGNKDKTTARTEAASTPAPLASASKQPGGQAALKLRLSIDPDIRNRSRTAAVLWGALAVIGALQQYGPNNVGMASSVWAAFSIVTCMMALLCLFVGPRLAGRTFEVSEELSIAIGWVATGALVAATGGASSPDIGLFAVFVFYSAYFVKPRAAFRQLIAGTIVMWAPLFYDFSAVGESAFIATALVMTVVLWSMAALIARNRHVALAAELRARRLALTDPLTGVANLLTFEDELAAEIDRSAAAENHSLGVAFVDVNGLKAANTVFGHAGGDELIRRTADALIATAGENDQVARVGGDEFAVIVPGAAAEHMKTFEAEFAIALSEAGRGVEGELFDLSASIGTAVYPQDGASLDDLMTVADARMYDSKAALPPRLPTPETSGGRALLDPPNEEASPFEALVMGAAPAAALAWLVGGSLIMISAAFTDTPNVHLSLALAMTGLCLAVAGFLGVVSDAHRPQAERITNSLAVLIALPVVYATGGAATPVLPLAYLVVAHASFALSEREAALRTGAMLGIIGATLVFNANTSSFTSVMVIGAGVLVIAALLQYNRRLAINAEKRALELSRIDALTKIANRRVFEQALADASEGVEVLSEIPGGLVLADVDNFKTINTTGGHRSGDEVLRMLAAVLKDSLSDFGTVCRIGGDEFAVIVEGGSDEAVMRAAAKCRVAVQSVDWKVLCEPEVTLSIGYATWSQVDSWKDLVIASDVAMQTSKDFGKNSVTKAPREAAVPRLGPQPPEQRFSRSA